MANADGDSSKDTIQRAQPKIAGRIVAFGFDDEVLPETFYVEIQSDAGERKKYLANASMQISFEQNRFDVGDAIETKLGADGRIADVLAVKVAEKSNEPRVGDGEPVAAIDAIRRVQRNKRADQAATNSATKTSDTPVVASPPATLLNGRFVRDEVGIYRRIGEEREALADEGDKIRFIDKQIDAFQAAIELAKAKSWEAIEVTGSEKFRAEAWFHAKSAGLEVIGYEATAQDQQRLAKAAEQLATKLAASAPPLGTAAQTIDADRLAKEMLVSRQQAQDFALGHRLRDPSATVALPTDWQSVPVVIVGGGIAGLSAGWRLLRQGFRDFLVLDLELERLVVLQLKVLAVNQTQLDPFKQV